MKRINIFIIIGICILFLSAREVFSQQSPLYFKGGSDGVLYGSDTIILENTVTDECKMPVPYSTLDAGFTFLYSEYLSLFYFSLNYSLTQNFQINFTLPYFIKSVADNNNKKYDKLGFGDTGTGFSFFISPGKNIDSITRLKCTLPTGDPVASDGNTIIPMGYGTPVFSLLQTFSLSPEILSVRAFANAGIIYYPETVREPGLSRYQIGKKFTFSALLGIGREFISGLFFQCKINYVYIPESEYKIDYTMNNGTWIDRNDSLISSDVIPVVKYRFFKDFTGSLIGTIPVYEKQDSDIEDPHKREWKVLLNITKEFTSEPVSNKKIINKKAR